MRNTRFILSAIGLATAFSFAANPVIKVDFDQSGRTSTEVTESGYVPWVVTGVSSADTTLSGVKITVSKGSAGSALKTNWYKASVQNPNYARLVGDGIIVDGGNSGGEISLRFRNLSAGTHSLLAYLNNVDAPTAYTYSNIDVYVNDVKKQTVTPSNRALKTADAATAYVTFTVSNGGEATVRFAPSSSSATFRNVTLNGFALNVPNSAYQATEPSPSDGDYHASGDAGTVKLSWKAAPNAAKHRVFVGTDSASVAAATVKSDEYKGEQTGTAYSVSGAYALYRYYWRVDEVDSQGGITQGSVWSFGLGRLAFVDAEGYGRTAVGGRGGKVVYVTNLNDSGEGSFREACTADIGPRTILFKVSGIIELKSRLTCNQSYVTIAGQSAPGKGITIRSAPVGFTGNDMIIRFMRVRLGYGQTYDGMGLTGGDHSILDHASISWTIDEAFSSRGAKNITLQRTLISEALNIANHQNYPAGTGHGYAATIGGDIGSFHHNLLAHNEGRNWSMGGGLDGDGYYAGRLDIFNNVVYNWYSRVTDGGAHEVNFVGNFYKEGAATKLHGLTLKADLEGTGKGSQAYYYHNNILQAANGSYTCDGKNDECGRTYTLSNGQTLDWDVWNSSAFFPSYANIQTARAAYKDVLSDVGQRMPVFDDHDTRIIGEVKNQTYKYKGSVSGLPGIPDRESDVGGYESYPSTSWADDYDSDLDGLPDWWEKMYGYNTKSSKGDFSDANNDRLGDGWTELERYLEWLARPHYSFESGETQVIDLSNFTAGYNGGTYKLTSVPSGVTAKLSGSKMTVSLDAKFGGVGYIEFLLTDSEGDTFSRFVGVSQGAMETSSPTKASTITKCGAGSSKQSVAAGDSIVPFCYEYSGATSLSFDGLPEGITVTDTVLASGAKQVLVRGAVLSTVAAGEYAYTVSTVGHSDEGFSKSGVITVAGEGSTTALRLQNRFDVHLTVSRGIVSLTGLPEEVQISVTDISGKNRMLQKNVVTMQGQATVSLDRFGAGIYLLNLKSKNWNRTYRVVR